MQAFPKDSMNSVLGGSGPVNKNIDIARFHGHQADSFGDFNSTAAAKDVQPSYEPYAGAGTVTRPDARPGVDRASTFNPRSKADMLHGDESLGLGTSTFLEGAPAARIAIQRRESEGEVSGLVRKKSLAQKIRGISNARPAPRGGLPGGPGSPEVLYERTTSPERLVHSAGGLPKIAERNPFFQDYDTEYEKKGATIKNRVVRSSSEAEDVKSPGADSLRRVGTDGPAANGGGAEDPKSTGGFMSRVKSLRGGGRGKPRAERKE